MIKEGHEKMKKKNAYENIMSKVPLPKPIASLNLVKCFYRILSKSLISANDILIKQLNQNPCKCFYKQLSKGPIIEKGKRNQKPCKMFS